MSIEQIKALMSKHDWFYNYADDVRTWNNGNYEKQQLLKLVKTIPASEIPELMSLVPEPLKQIWEVELNNNVRAGEAK